MSPACANGHGLPGPSAPCCPILTSSDFALAFARTTRAIADLPEVNHSLLFAALLAVFVTLVSLRHRSPGASLPSIGSYLFLVTTSQRLTMTGGGLGVAFFSPFNNDRCFLPAAADPSFTDERLSVLHRARLGSSLERASLDWASRSARRGCGLRVAATRERNYLAAARRRMSSCLRASRSRSPGPVGLASMLRCTSASSCSA